MSATMLFNNLITFSRGTSATLTGPTGLIQWAPMNLLTYSEQFDNAAWIKSDNTVTANAVVSPDGSTNADTATPTGATPIVRQTYTTSTTGAYTGTIWLKSASNANVTISLRPTGAGSPASVVCAVTSTWQRFTVNLTAVAGVTNIQFWVEQFSQAVYLWGAQLELGTTATTYNSTTTKNLLGYSEAFDNAAWTKVRTSVVTGAAANPINGLFNAQKLMEDTTASNSHFASQTVSGHISGTTYTFSIYAKAAGRTQLRMNGDTALGLSNPAIFNLDTGTVASNGAFTASIQSIGNGWYRCVCTGTPTAAGSGVWVVGLAVSGTTSYTGDGNSGVYIWGAQLSDSGSLDPYVPTPGAAPTSAAYYGPRFDYDPVTLAPRGLLIEEARTNLLTYSEQFDNAAWSKLGGAITANAAPAPDGTVAADQLIEDASTGLHIVYRTSAFTSGTTYTLSFWVKRGTGTRNASARLDDGVSTRRSIINLATGAVTPAAGHTVTARAWGAYWYVTCTVTAAATAVVVVGVEMVDGLNPTYTGDGTSGIYLWGAQLEAGAFATSYIPTVASTVTRSADVATLTGSNFAPWYNQSAGTFVASYRTATTAITQDLFMANAGAPLTASIGMYSSAGTSAIGWTRVGGVTQTSITVATSASADNKTAFGYLTNDFAITANGTLGLTDTSGTLPTVDRLTFGANNIGGSGQAFWIRSVTYYPNRLSNTQLQSLTT